MKGGDPQGLTQILVATVRACPGGAVTGSYQRDCLSNGENQLTN
jgi:hypothetical protein